MTEFDPTERFDGEQTVLLRARLELIGPMGWDYALGTGGVHRAERRGTLRHEQTALTADGLVKACEQREAQLVSGERDHVVQVHTGMSGTHDDSQES